MSQVYVQQQGESNVDAVNSAITGALATAAEVLVYSRVQPPAAYRTLPQPSYRVAANGLVTDLGGGFVPATLDGLVMDLDGDRDVTEDTGGVALWVNQAGGAAGNVTQGIAANRPGFTAGDATFNSHGSLNWTAIDRLQAPGGTALDVPAGGHLYHYFVTNLDPWVAAQPFIVQKATGGGYTIRHRTGDVLRVGGTNDSSAFIFVDSTTNIAGGPRILRAHYDDAGILGSRLNNDAEGVLNDGDGMKDGTAFWRLGDMAAGMVGDLARVLVYSRATAISAGDDAQLMTFLADFYGVTL